MHQKKIKKHITKWYNGAATYICFHGISAFFVNINVSLSTDIDLGLY